MRYVVGATVAALMVAIWACGGDTVTGTGPGQGTLSVRLKDRPLWFDSVAAVNVYVVRIDARVAVADSAESEVADDDADHDGERHEELEHHDSTGEHHEHEFEAHEWQTIATPDTTFNLLDLQNGVTAFLGTAVVDTGDFRALRLVIDPSKSSIVLKDGTVLTGDASPFGRFPSGERSGIKIFIDDDIHIRAHKNTIVIVDFDLEHSFVLRGSLMRNGLLFTPVIHAKREG